jgi:exodeoxyribonuclease VII small subunit
VLQLKQKNNDMAEKLSYEEAYKQLAEIANEIETETVSVDVLAEKVKTASMLIKLCQDKLRSTETEVNNIISQMGGEKS